MMNDLTKLEDENQEQYIYRVNCLIKEGKYKNWAEVTPIVNKELFGEDFSKYKGESAWRKDVASGIKYYENVFAKKENDEYISELKKAKLELELEKVKFRDERTEYNRVIRQEARKESYKDLIARTISTSVQPIDIKINTQDKQGDTSLIVHMTDLHTGIEIDNFKNKFNEEILKERFEKYINKIIKVGRTHNSTECHVVIGEVVSGLIHYTLRLENSLNMIEQFKYACELLSVSLLELSKEFNGVHVYITPGNHSRISPKKEESLDGENMDLLIPFYLRARLQNISNIEIHDNTVDPEIAMFEVRGQKVFSAHGHKDKPANVVQNFTMMFGVKPDIVLLGHMHTNAMTTVYDTKVLQSGCCSGSDSYALSIRKANRPEQTVSVISDEGFECLYDIQLD